MDGSIITHPKVWEASGHVKAFHDPLVECRKCRRRVRADHLVEDRLKIRADGLGIEELSRLIREKGLKCPGCGGELVEPRHFNLMFSTQVGPVEGNVSYLRPETAQLIFVDFFRIYRASRGTLPFGVAQVGRAFRNEISPRNFVFRSREFEQMELEYFFNPKKPGKWELGELKVKVLTREAQENPREMSFRELAGHTSEIHAYWLEQSYRFLLKVGLPPEMLRLRQHTRDELSHYAQDTWDIEFRYPFGWKELVGVANRTDFDLKQHAGLSGRELSVVDGDEKVYPWVIEPSFGVDRLVLAVLCAAWREDGRQWLALRPEIAPVQVAVFPLVSRDGMPEKAREIYERLRLRFRAFYDDKGSIGRRYRRQDSIGTPYCITVDGQTLKDGTVTVRERDGMEQERVKIDDLAGALEDLRSGPY